MLCGDLARRLLENVLKTIVFDDKSASSRK